MKDRWTKRDWKVDGKRHKKAYLKLAEYEDLEEQGLIVRVPSKVYFLSGSMEQIFEGNVKNVIYNTDNGAFDITALGESVFLTSAKAEKKLKELKGE